jgi:hypothetical protein
LRSSLPGGLWELWWWWSTSIFGGQLCLVNGDEILVDIAFWNPWIRKLGVANPSHKVLILIPVFTVISKFLDFPLIVFDIDWRRQGDLAVREQLRIIVDNRFEQARMEGGWILYSGGSCNVYVDVSRFAFRIGNGLI